MMYQKSIRFCAVFLLHTCCNAATHGSQPAQEKAQATYYQITQPPAFRALHEELVTTLHSLPIALITMIAEYSREGWFLAYMNTKNASHQRKIPSGPSSLIVFYVHNNLPLMNKYLVNGSSQLQCHTLSGREQAITTIEDSLFLNKKLLDYDGTCEVDERLAPATTLLVTNVLTVLLTQQYENTVCLQPYDSQAATAGGENSLIYITVSPQTFSKACKNYHTYLKSERDSWAAGITAGWNYTVLSHIVRFFPHKVMDALAEDETGKKVPVVYGGGTLEECVKHFKKQQAKQSKE